MATVLLERIGDVAASLLVLLLTRLSMCLASFGIGYAIVADSRDNVLLSLLTGVFFVLAFSWFLADGVAGFRKETRWQKLWLQTLTILIVSGIAGEITALRWLDLL